MRKLHFVFGVVILLSILIIPSSLAQDLFAVEAETVTGTLETRDGFIININFPVPTSVFPDTLSKIKAQKYTPDINSIKKICEKYNTSVSQSNNNLPQTFIDIDGNFETQYIYSLRDTELYAQIVGIRSLYRKQDLIYEDDELKNTAYSILKELEVSIEKPIYYVAKGNIDYGTRNSNETFIYDDDTVIIARQLIENYPLAATQRFMHNGTVYTGGFVALVFNKNKSLVFLDLHGIIRESENRKKSMPCISWEKALKNFLHEKKDFSLETFDEQRLFTIAPKSVNIISIMPSMIYAEKSGEITPVWEIDAEIEFDQIMHDKQLKNMVKNKHYYINAWTGEYLCFDP